MKKISIIWKTYNSELIALLVNVVVSLVSFIYASTLLAVIITVVVLALSTFIIIFIKTKDKDFYFLPLDKIGSEKDWIGIGKFFYLSNENCYEITESHAGYIFPSVLDWSDYKFEFDFKIINRCLAWVVRANNLSNYVMFQCDLTGINPHIRLNGEWIIKNQQDKDVNFIFDGTLSPDTWYHVKIFCEKRNIRIVIYGKQKAIFDRHWKIPEQLIITYRKSLDPENKEEIRLLQNIDFDFGAVGFRDHGDEKGLIKNIYLEKL